MEYTKYYVKQYHEVMPFLFRDENNSRNCFLQDLLDALNQLEQGLKDNIKKLSSFDKYKQEVLLGHLDWSPMHKDPIFWRENISSFEEHDFQVHLYVISVFLA